MSDSWDAPRPTKRSRRRGDSEQQEEKGDGAAGEDEGRIQRPPPQYMHPPAAPYYPPYGVPPPYPPQQWPPPVPPQGPYPPQAYGQQQQHYWAQHPQASPSQQQLPLSPPISGPGPMTAEPAAGASMTASSSTGAESETGALAVPGIPPLEISSTSGGKKKGKKGSKKPLDPSSKKEKKNAQSRARAAKLRDKIDNLKVKSEDEKTEEERKIYESYEERRRKKNERSRERAIEKKAEIERISAIPEEERSEEDKRTLAIAMKAKLRKNEGDRLRRERLKRMGLSSKSSTSRGRPRKSASSTISSEEVASAAKQIEPASPVPPSLPPQDLPLPSPSTFMSPGLMSSLGFPSPPSRRSVAPPSESGVGVSPQPSAQVPLPMIPPETSFQQMASPPTWSQLHLPQRSSNVQQQRHADGSITISIFGAGGGTGTSGEEAARPSGSEEGAPPPAGSTGEPNAGVNYSDVSHLLLYGSNSEQERKEGDDEAAGGRTGESGGGGEGEIKEETKDEGKGDAS